MISVRQLFEKSALFSHVFHNVFAGFFRQLITFFQQIIIRHFIDPASLGLWSYVGAIQSSAATLDLGMDGALYRSFAVLKAEPNENIVVLRSTAFLGKLLQACAIAICIVCAYGFFEKDTKLFFSYFFASILVVFSMMIESLLVYHQLELKFKSLNRIQMIVSVIAFIISPLSAYLFGVLGIGVAFLFLQIIQCVMLFYSAKKNAIYIKLRMCKKYFRHLLIGGVSIRITDYPLGFLAVADLLLVGHSLGMESLAVYSTAKNLANQLAEIPARISGVILAKLYANYEQLKENKSFFWEYFCFLYMIFFPVFIIGAFFVFLVVFNIYVKKYFYSLFIFKILVFVVYFSPQTSIIRNWWIIEEKYLLSFIINTLSLSFFMGLFYLGFSNIEGISIAFLMSYFLHFVLLVFLKGKSIWDLFSCFKLIILSVVSCSYVYVCLDKMLLQKDVYSVFSIKTLSFLFIVLTLPVLLFMLRCYYVRSPFLKLFSLEKAIT